MTTKRSSPLNNPSQEKPLSPSSKTNRSKYPDGNGDKGESGGVSKGGRERVKPAEALLKCQMCGRVQKLVFRVGRPPEWHRCIWCHELQPIDGYRVVGYGLGLPQPLSPHEVETRQREIELQSYNPNK